MNYNFIKEVSRILEMYTTRRELSGENFNIFSVMSMEADEVFTHSALLAELLNPKGSHGLGSQPLQLFIKDFLDAEFKMNFKNAICKKEDHISFANKGDTEGGGRVDIIVKDSDGNIIIIENKIYAGEQVDQLQRYRNSYPKAELFYLTLDGKESAQLIDGASELKIYRNLSYKEDITKWITQCARLAYEKPMLREILTQYLHLLKKLTNTSTQNEMSQKITEIISENFEACLEIYKNFDTVSINMKDKLLQDLHDTLKMKYQELNFSFSMNKEVKTIDITGFKEDVRINFRFKNQKWPVISILPGSAFFSGVNLATFKTDTADGKISAWWKILPILTDDRLLPNYILVTRETFLSAISDTIEKVKNTANETQSLHK